MTDSGWWDVEFSSRAEESLRNNLLTRCDGVVLELVAALSLGHFRASAAGVY